jgi:hypothetical protein
MFGTGRRCNVEAAIPFLSSYLTIAKPSIINTCSGAASGAFYMDLFRRYWNRANNYQYLNNHVNFFGMRNIPSTINEMESYTDGEASFEAKSLEKKFKFQTNIGKVSIFYYGPEKDDFCLILPSRDTGSLKYDPVIQKHLCYESYIVSLLLEKLERMVETEVSKRNIASMTELDTIERKKVFLNIKDTFNQGFEKSSLYPHFAEAQFEIKTHYDEVLKRRERGRKVRKEAESTAETES